VAETGPFQSGSPPSNGRCSVVNTPRGLRDERAPLIRFSAIHSIESSVRRDEMSFDSHVVAQTRDDPFEVLIAQLLKC